MPLELFMPFRFRHTEQQRISSAACLVIKMSASPLMFSVPDLENIRSGGADALLYARFSKALGLYVIITVRDGKVAKAILAEAPPEQPHGKEHPYLSRILEHLSTGKGDLSGIPLDLKAPPFERRVLEALRTIPPGEVVTYGEIARMLDNPRAARAVGHACAMNPVLIVVPCHRVVPASGGLGNYSAAQGPATKRTLLEIEGALSKVRGMNGA